MKLKILVKPGQAQDKFEKYSDFYRAKIKAPAREGRANDYLIRFLAEHFDVARSSVRIVSGEKARIKIVEILEE